MKDNFPIALDATLKWEGGFVDDPKDPGGATYQGVTQAVYSAWRKQYELSPQHVISMSTRERDAIYKTRYWDAVHCDDMPSGVDLLAFDIAVNSGPGRVKQWLQGSPKDPVACVRYLDSKRRGFWKSLPIFGRFGKGWLARENDVFSKAMKIAIEGHPESPEATSRLAQATFLLDDTTAKPQENSIMPTFQGWRTLAVFLATTIVGALQAFNWVQVLPTGSQATGTIVSVLGIVGMVLRSITSTPIGTSSK